MNNQYLGNKEAFFSYELLNIRLSVLKLIIYELPLTSKNVNWHIINKNEIIRGHKVRKEIVVGFLGEFWEKGEVYMTNIYCICVKCSGKNKI